MNQTIIYYNTNAKAFCDDTFHADMSHCRNKFLSYLARGSFILDAGCGSGRDSRYFMEHGYSVEAFDAAEEICRIAGQNIGQAVKCMEFRDIVDKERFHGIWACASLLHVSREELPFIMQKLYQALIPRGILYASFKYGTSEALRGGRQFSDFREDTAKELFETAGFTLLECFITSDVRAERSNEMWINVIGRK